MSILYTSYNSVLLIPILISIKDFIKNKKEIKFISIGITIIMIILLLCILSFLVITNTNIDKMEMPAVYAVNSIIPKFKKIYGIIILVAIFTTAISLGISFLKNVSKEEKKYNYFAIFICISSVFFSKIGFAKLVSVLYPILGVLGLLQTIKILT